MSLHFEMKLGFGKKKFDIEKLLSEHMSYGVYEDAYRLEEGAKGFPTVVYDQEKIGRGVEVNVQRGKLTLDSLVPSTESDVEILFELMQRAIDLLGIKEIEFEDRKIKSELLEELKDDIKYINRLNLHILQDALEEDPQRSLMIYGAVQIICIGEEVVNRIGESWEEYGNYLHEVQAQDLYFAKPMFLQKEEDILGLYILTSGVISSLPLKKDFLVDTEETPVSKWGVGFNDFFSEELLGMISYDDFLANVDTTNMLDAERFIIELNCDEMKKFLETYGETR